VQQWRGSTASASAYSSDRPNPYSTVAAPKRPPQTLVQKMTARTFALPSVCHANFLGVMHYEGVEYVVRASLGRNEWALLIYFPDKAPDSSPTVVKFSGSRDEAGAAARRRIDNWIKRQQRG
jgi:hypothetical protein